MIYGVVAMFRWGGMMGGGLGVAEAFDKAVALHVEEVLDVGL